MADGPVPAAASGGYREVRIGADGYNSRLTLPTLAVDQKFVSANGSAVTAGPHHDRVF